MLYTGKDTPLVVDGKRYMLSRFTRALEDEFVEWAKSVLPNPIAVIGAGLSKLPANVQEMLVKEAVAKACALQSFFNPDIQSLVGTPAGSVKLFSLLLRKYQPELTEDDVINLIGKAGRDEDLKKAFRQVYGTVPEDEGEKDIQVMSDMGLIEPEKKG